MAALQNSVTFGSWSVGIAVMVTAGITVILKLLFARKPMMKLPPGPRGLPIIGALHLIGKHPHKDLAKLAERYGPLMSLWMGQQLTVVASSPAAAEEVLKTQGPSFSGRLKTSFGHIVLPGDIAMQSDTPARLHLKKIFHLQLSTTRQLQQTEELRAQEITHMVHIISRDDEYATSGVQLRACIGVAVTNILSRMVLKKRFMAVNNNTNNSGTKPPVRDNSSSQELEDWLELEEVRNFRTIAEDIATLSLHIDPGDFIHAFKWLNIGRGFKRQLQNLRGRMDAFMGNIVVEHLAQRKRRKSSSGDASMWEKDMVDVLLDQMEDDTLRFDVTTEMVTSVLWDAFAAGTNTTTDAGEWAMAECIRNPKVMAKAQAELDDVVGRSRRVEDADIPNLKYLQAVIKEALRLHPATPLLFPHVNENACKVFGYDVPTGTMVLVNAGAIARDPKLWEDPLEFKPERFLEGMPHADTDMSGKHFELVPFGSGRRACPGVSLAMALVHILVATLLQSFNWSLPNGLQPVDLDMSEAAEGFPTRAQALVAIPKARMSISL